MQRGLPDATIDWRFEADLELAQFAPEMVRSGLGALPPARGR